MDLQPLGGGAAPAPPPASAPDTPQGQPPLPPIPPTPQPYTPTTLAPPPPPGSVAAGVSPRPANAISPAPSESAGMSKGLIAGIASGLVAALVIFAVIAYRLTHPPVPPATAPSAYALYTVPDKAFSCQAPDGWEKTEAGGGGMMSGVLFKKGLAKIDIDSDLQGSLMGDIIESGNQQGMAPDPLSDSNAAPMPLPTPKPAVEKVHEQSAKSLESRYQGYEEQQMRTVECPFGEARCSEWTGTLPANLMTGRNSQSLHGYRVTALGNERRLTVICSCPEADWQTLKPAFEKVILSVSNGGG